MGIKFEEAGFEGVLVGDEVSESIPERREARRALGDAFEREF